jgi:hypothetical protein
MNSRVAMFARHREPSEVLRSRASLVRSEDDPVGGVEEVSAGWEYKLVRFLVSTEDDQIGPHVSVRPIFTFGLTGNRGPL